LRDRILWIDASGTYKFLCFVVGIEIHNGKSFWLRRGLKQHCHPVSVSADSPRSRL